MGLVKWTRTTPVVGALGQSKQADSTGEVLNSPVHSPKQAEQADSTGARRSRTAPVVRVGHSGCHSRVVKFWVSGSLVFIFVKK